MPIRPSYIGVNFSLKWLISQKWPGNLSSFLGSTIMYCKHVDLVESFERSNLAYFSL